MIDNTTENNSNPQLVKSFRISPSYLALIEQECAMRKIGFSEFVRQSVLANMKHMRRQAIEAWGK